MARSRSIKYRKTWNPFASKRPPRHIYEQWTPYQQWSYECERIRGHIHRVQNTPTIHGRDWIAKQCKYWRDKLAELEANPPRY